jgi:prepilin-type N-terminal cleavage/methylation domain-containing protein/prepilin-type processing-associated H-X9-DG protein
MLSQLREKCPRHEGAPTGFTVVELLVTAAIVGILSAILLPALSQGKGSARRVQCIDNLRQLGVATRLYWDDHDDATFPYLAGSTNGGRIYWFGWIKAGPEGSREFDGRDAALHAYLGSRDVSLCPSLDYGSTRYKLKAAEAACNYGYNRHLGSASINASSITRPASTALFADAAQVNDFQAPASPEQPLLEEFYYVDADQGAGYPNAHFRHRQSAQVAFCDGHVESEKAVPGSYDPRLPREFVGRLRKEILILKAPK